MAGNVEQLVRGLVGADYYQHSATRNPSGPETGEVRVVRGGDYFTGYPEGLAVSRRDGVGQTMGLVALGFRCVIEPRRQ